MITYISAFIFYTFAMVGIILVGFIIYKKVMSTTKSENKGLIKIIDCTTIGPKKNLLVVKIKNEKFLIASGAEHTTFLSKLNYEEQNNIQIPRQRERQNNQQQEETDYEQQERLAAQRAQLEQIKMAKLNKIRNQFKQLYNQDEIQQTPQRKAIVRKLLKDLDNTTSSQGGRF